MPLKIAICVNHYWPSVGGAEKVVQTIAEYLAQYHSLFIFTRKLDKRRDPRDFDFPIFEYRDGDVGYFEKKLQSIKPDVVLVYSDVFDFFRPLIARRQPFKLILALCGANWLHKHRNYVGMIYRNVNNIHALICHSKQERDYRICLSDKINHKTIIIPNGVWTEEFDKNMLGRQELAPKIAGKRWILNVSNFFPGKGQEHLIKIVNILPDPEQLAYIQISNDIAFPIGQQLESRWRISKSALKKKGIAVKLIKNASREQVIGFFKQSNVFAFTSEKEVAPLVLLESMAASLPWISTNIGNALDLKGGKCINSIKDSRFHTVFDQRVQLNFANEIQNLWNNPTIGEEGRQQINEELNWNKILPQYKSIIEG